MPLDDPPPTLLAVLVVYAVMSAATFVAYAVDKSAARRTRRRVSEKTLHLLALLGGWPGALLAMPVFRHKRRKTPFVAVLWSIALAHAVGWIWCLGGFRTSATFLGVPPQWFGTN
jgi:uncharacterized membrane protein YsdA (DUF1294 family)